MDIRGLACCGVREISGLSWSRGRAEDFMREFCRREFSAEEWQRQPRAFYIFSQANPPNAGQVVTRYDGRRRRLPVATYGDHFCAYIRGHHLGTVAETGSRRNPNSGNNVKVWVWAVDQEALKAWARAHGAMPGPLMRTFIREFPGEVRPGRRLTRALLAELRAGRDRQQAMPNYLAQPREGLLAQGAVPAPPAPIPQGLVVPVAGNIREVA